LNKKAFSLIELLIVIVIIGVVYTLAIKGFAQVADNTKQVSIGSLKEYLQSIPHENRVEFLCLDDCSSCDVFVDGEIAKSLKGKFDNFLDSSVKVYRYDFYQGLLPITEKTYFNDEGVEENICFSYSVDKGGVGDQVFVEYNKKVYDFTAYFEKIAVYNTTSELINMKEKIVGEVLK